MTLNQFHEQSKLTAVKNTIRLYQYELDMEDTHYKRVLKVSRFQNQTVLEAIKTCFWTHNAHDLETQYQRSLCAIEMKSFMYAAVNSESCLKRSDFKLNFNPTQFCDPLGDRNIHWPLAPLDENNNTVIIVTARLDASSLFDGVSPGAGNAVTGLVTLLATAYYLNFLNATVDSTY